MAHPLADFIQAAEPVIRRGGLYPQLIEAIEPLVGTLIENPNWLEERFRRPILQKAYAQYLLYRPEDLLFSVVSFVWNPRQGSPIHDHCTWGVIGQYVGVEEESRFRLLPGGGIGKARVVTVRPGDVSHVYPPGRDIHQIVNRGATPTISIHVYGGDIGSQARHIYDPATGEKRPFISGYD